MKPEELVAIEKRAEMARYVGGQAVRLEELHRHMVNAASPTDAQLSEFFRRYIEFTPGMRAETELRGLIMKRLQELQKEFDEV